MTRKIFHVVISVFIFISIFSIDSVFAVTTPSLVDSKPDNWQENVPTNTDITFTFNDEIINVHEENITFYERHTNNNFYEQEIKEIKLSGKSVTIVPKEALHFNKEYKIEIKGYTVELKNGYYIPKISNTFKTNYMSFYDLMVVDNAKLASLLTSYTPRQLIVSAPERYIEKITINHKKKGKTEEDPNQKVTEALTNVDILVEKTGVSKVKVDILSDNKVISSRYAKKVDDSNGQANSGQDIYTLGFGGLPVNFDVKITVFDTSLYIMDQLTVKVASSDKLFTEVAETYNYQTTGKSFTLYELVADEKLFNALLTENDMKKLMVQVDE